VFARERFEGRLIHAECCNGWSVTDIIQASRRGRCRDRAIFITRAMQCGDDDRPWCRCRNAFKICIERHGLRAKERWCGEICVCTARDVTATMPRWQWAE